MCEMRLSLNKIFEIIFFFCLNFSIIYRSSQIYIHGSIVPTIFNIVAVGAFCAKYFLVRKFGGRDLLCLFTIIIIGFIYAAYYLNIGVLNIGMAILIAKDMEFKRIFKYNFITLLIIFSLICVSSFAGMSNVYAKDAYKLGEIRSLYSFGFISSNTPGLYIFAILTAYNLIRGVNIKIKEIIFELFLTGVAFLLFASRTSTISLVVYLLGLMFCKKYFAYKAFKFLMYPWQYSFVLFAGITFYTVLYFDTSAALAELNILLSDRLHLLSTVFYYSGIHFLGNSEIIDLLGLSVDNAYIFTLAAYGILMIIFYGVVFIYSSKVAYQRGDWGILMTVIAYVVYGIGENHIFFSTICNVLLIFGYFVMNSDWKIDKTISSTRKEFVIKEH